MTADLVARLEKAAAHPLLHESDARLFREAASALRSSGEAVAELRGLRYVRDYIATSGQDYGIGSYRTNGSGFERNFSNRDDLLCCIDRQIEKLSATPASAWRPIAEAQEGKLYVVGWLDGEDTKSPARHDFDYIEDGCWVGHEDCVQHADACAPPGSRLPPREPPYQWLIEVPEFPTPPTSPEQPHDDP